MNTYTVIGLYSDDVRGDSPSMREASWVEIVHQAPTPTIAARVARRAIVARGDMNTEDVEELCVLAVFEGTHSDHYEPSLDTEEYERQIEAEDA